MHDDASIKQCRFGGRKFDFDAGFWLKGGAGVQRESLRVRAVYAIFSALDSVQPANTLTGRK